MTNSPWLLIMIALPLLGAVVVGSLGGSMGTSPSGRVTVKTVALLFSIAELVVAAVLWVLYRHGLHEFQLSDHPAGTRLPFFEQFSIDWIPSFGINFSLGLDGISLVMIALIAVLVPIVIGASWEEKLPAGRTIGGYLSLILVLQAAMTGVFAATNVFLFYVMFEVMLIPMYFLIGAFGGVRGSYAAMKFFLYSLLGGLLMLASLIGLYVASGQQLTHGTLDFAELQSIATKIPHTTQLWIFAGFAIAFAIKAPLVPLHTWLPDAGAEAPAGAGTLLVGILDKVGTFGFLRICLPLLPAAAHSMSWLIILLGVVGIIYGAIVAAGQTDMKRFITYTSIAHFGFICMGIFAFTTQALSGAVLYMVNHGIATALIFLIAGFLTARGGSRLMSDYGGVWKVAPIMGGLFLIGSMATIAVPGTNSFVSEFLVLIGTFTRFPVWATIATVGIVLAAVYMLWMFQKVFTGPVRGSAVIEVGSADDHGVPVDPQPSVTGPSGQADQFGGAPTGGDTAQDAQGAGMAVATATRAPELRPGGNAIPVRRKFGDLKPHEIAVLTPLVVLVFFLGVYPKPVLDVINPTAVQTLDDSQHTDLPPALGACRTGVVRGATSAAYSSTLTLTSGENC